MNKLYRVGAYVRLSVESTSYDSESVENQCSMLSKFIAMMPGWVETKFYIDDGVSGAHFNRKGFQEMVADARDGLINLVLVKDLSRFGRNYLEAGHYLEEVLPALGCRFVSLTESIDTENGESDIVPFLNAMNDYYVKNHSERIRSIMAAKAKDGQKVSGQAPYGYRRNPEENTRLLIDEYSAGIVRQIFEMRKQGKGFYTIAKVLNADAILPPKLYYLSIMGRDDSHVKTRHWRPAWIGHMVKNELYIGNAVQLKKKVVSYRDKREVSRPEEEQIRIDDVFPVIIDRDTWDAVQAVNEQASNRHANRRDPEKKLFSGILFCADCGASLVAIQNNKRPNKDGTFSVHYLCGKYHSTGGADCSRHSISEKVLSGIIFEQIQQWVEQVRLDEQSVLKTLTNRLIGDGTSADNQYKKEITLLKQRLHKLETTMTKLYEDRVNKLISEASFATLIQKNEAERQENEKRLSLLETSQQEAAEKLSDIQKWLGLIKANSTIGNLNRDLLENMIERIEVNESKIVDGVKEREIKICYKFIGAME